MEQDERRVTLLAAIAVALGAGTFGFTIASADTSTARGIGMPAEVPAPHATPRAPDTGGAASCGAGACGSQNR